jgi:carbamate kinase
VPGIALIAIGGNALVHEGESGSLIVQSDRARQLAASIVELLDRGWTPVITHGNGPQVGFIMRRGEIAAPEARGEQLPDLPLWLAVADSQGGIGHLLASALHSALRGRAPAGGVAAVITHTVVDEQDPAFQDPTKPIGGVMDAATAGRRVSSHGWDVVEVGSGRFRRVVPSPAPLEILEVPAIRTLVGAGTVVVAAGGGGIPLVRKGDDLVPVDAVVDKDRASAMLAAQLGVDVLVLVTGVDQVFVDFRGPHERALDVVSREEASSLAAAGHFPPGSMGPKVESALAFLAGGGAMAVITSMGLIGAALEGRAGTCIMADQAGRGN